MANKEKSVIEQALLEAAQIDATFKANAKEILTQTMGSEIEEMVKESLKGSRTALNEDEDDDMASNLVLGDEEMNDDLDLEMGDEDNEMEDEDLDLTLDLGSEDMEDENDMEVVDLTDADDAELIRVFKSMDPDSEIEVVQNEDGISFTDNETGAEYQIEFGGNEEYLDDEDIDGIDMEDENSEMEDEDEVVYEIEMTEEDEEELEEGRFPTTLSNSARIANRKSSDIGDNRRKLRSESRTQSPNVTLIKENKTLKTKLTDLQSENVELKENQEKMVDALKQFRQKLQEVAVFNSNLAHVVRLFTENTTTKEEKVEIVKRMDEASTIKESKLIFETLKKELQGVKTKKSIKESIDDKVNKTASTGSKQTITESKVYVHPELEKMKKMWEFNYKY